MGAMTTTTESATATAQPPANWTQWRVAPSSAFQADGPGGSVGMIQIDRTNFWVTTTFRFDNPEVTARLVAQIRTNNRAAGRNENDPNPVAMVASACTFAASESPTDMASIPAFLRWFVNTYGRHTLAAIIHDQLIQDRPNAGALQSDTLSDRLFREMMRSAGVPWLKRWIMWTAVAVRSRWAVGGWKRVRLLIWLVLAVCGIGIAVAAFGSAVFGWAHVFGWSPSTMLAVAVATPIASAPLWGKQFGASFIAAPAAIFILPATILAAMGSAVYWILERTARTLGIR